MSDLAILTPSRGRPAQLARLVNALDKTCRSDWRLYVGLDYDDESNYWGAVHGLPAAEADRVYAQRGYRRPLSAWTNTLAKFALEETPREQPPKFIASLGDDHLPETDGWDTRLMGAIGGLGAPGFAYGNDGIRGMGLPTAWVVSTSIVRALEWVMLPVCQHMYVDNAIMRLGQATGRIVYCPDAKITHMHPIAKKAEWDTSYHESNSPERYAEDRAAFDAWCTGGGLSAAADIVRRTTK